MLLRGLGMTKVTDGTEFLLLHPVEISGTYSYEAVSGGRKTVLVLECNNAKLREIDKKLKTKVEAEQQAAAERVNAEKESAALVEAAKWRTWTFADKEVEARYGGKINAVVTIVTRDGGKLKVNLDDLSEPDRAYVKDSDKTRWRTWSISENESATKVEAKFIKAATDSSTGESVVLHRWDDSELVVLMSFCCGKVGG